MRPVTGLLTCCRLLESVFFNPAGMAGYEEAPGGGVIHFGLVLPVTEHRRAFQKLRCPYLWEPPRTFLSWLCQRSTGLYGRGRYPFVDWIQAVANRIELRRQESNSSSQRPD